MARFPRGLARKRKELTRLHDALAEQRLQLPWVRVDQAYEFEGADGKVSPLNCLGTKRRWQSGTSCSALAGKKAARVVPYCQTSTCLPQLTAALGNPSDDESLHCA
jgi:hypothetical protein